MANQPPSSTDDLGPSTSQLSEGQSLNPSARVGEDIMTDRYTNAEWAIQIAETQKNVVAQQQYYAAPKLGSKEFAQTIDHTLLKLDATAAQIDTLCSEARVEGFKSVCVRLPFVARSVSNLKGSSVVVACVIGFHEGTYDSHSKFREAQAAVSAGASELDIVLNHQIITSFTPKTHKTVPSDATTESITASNTASNAKPSASSVKREEGPYSPGSKSAQPPFERSNSPTTPNYAAIYTELASLRSLCPAPTVLKLILETAALTPSQILAASTLAAAANFDFIKTSTGFAGRGASLEDVVLMTAAAEYLSTQQPKGGERRRRMQVKASGGVRSLEDALKMLEAGATRLGTSSGLWIMQESRRVLKEREMSSEEKAKASERPGGGVTRLFTDDSVEGY